MIRCALSKACSNSAACPRRTFKIASSRIMRCVRSSPSSWTCSRAYEGVKVHERRRETQSAPDGMETAPRHEEPPRLLGCVVTTRLEELVVGRQDDDERERDD